MEGFIRKSIGPSDKYGQILFFVDEKGFIRKSTGPNDKYGQILYFFDDEGFIRKSTGPSDRYGQIIYFVDKAGFVRKSTGPSDKYGQIAYFIDENGFVRKSTGPSDRYGEILYFCHLIKKNVNTAKDTSVKNDSQGALLALALALAILMAPIIIVLGMFGKFVLKGLFKNVLPLDAFKKFRKTFTIICLSWFGLAVAACVLLLILVPNLFEVAFGALCVGNIVLFVLSIVIGNSIYKKHKDELPMQVETTNQEDLVEQKEEVEKIDENQDVIVPNEISNNDNLEVDRTVEALKKFKELLDMGIITQKEFDAKKKELLNGKPVSKKEKVKKDISDKPFMVMSRILSIVAVVLFFTGAIFLIFARDYSTINDSDGIMYFSAAFKGNVAALLTIIFGFVFYMFTIIQLVLNFKNKPSYKLMIIMGIIGILFAGAAIPFGFISMDDYRALVFSILMSSSCLFFIFQFVMIIIMYGLNKKKIDSTKTSGI